MVQKQKDKQDSKVSDVTDGLRNGLGTDSSKTLAKNKSMPVRLKDAIFKEGNVQNGVISGSVTSIAGLIFAGLIPTTVLPLLVGFAVGGAALGKVLPNDVFSVMGGTAVAGFFVFLLSVNVPVLGLGLITTLLLTILGTGVATAAHQYASDSGSKY